MSRRISRSRLRLLGLEGGVETNFLKLSRFSRPSRLSFFGVEIESLDRDHVETIRDPQPYLNPKISLPKRSFSEVGVKRSKQEIETIIDQEIEIIAKIQEVETINFQN
jgi:hypothetical protein